MNHTLSRYLYAPLCVMITITAGLSRPSIAETIVDAQYKNPTMRYGHFAAGRLHEYAALAVATNEGRTLYLNLSEDEVFEDISPRKIKLTTQPLEQTQLLTIVSHKQQGARLVIVRLNAGKLEIAAQSAAIGRPMRWLNPIGTADLDGDGKLEIMAVITPHIGGTMKVYRYQQGELIEIAALPGFSNHVFGSEQLDLSITLSSEGKVTMLVPDNARLLLREVALEAGKLVVKRSCKLDSPIVGSMVALDSGRIKAQLLGGEAIIHLQHCVN